MPTGKPTVVVSLLVARWCPRFYLPHWHEGLAVDYSSLSFQQKIWQRGAPGPIANLLSGGAEHPEVTISLPSDFSSSSY